MDDFIRLSDEMKAMEEKDLRVRYWERFGVIPSASQLRSFALRQHDIEG